MYMEHTESIKSQEAIISSPNTVHQDGEGSSGESPSHSTILHRRQFLDKKLDNYNQEKLKTSCRCSIVKM